MRLIARSYVSAGRLLVLALVVLTSACATTSPLDTARSQFRAGDPVAALETLDDIDLPRRDRLLLYLDRGMLAHAAGRYRDSIDAFDDADELIESLDRISVSEQGATLVINDQAAAYRGESAEVLWIRTFQMLNYLALGDAEGAAVEARRTLPILDKHGKVLKNDPVTRLLVAFAFEAAGQFESAGVEYRKLVEGDAPPSVLSAAWRNARLTARPDTAAALAKRLPDSTLEKAKLALEKRQGELVILLADGFVSRKRSGDLFVSTDLRISFPYYEYDHGPPAPRLTAQVDGQTVAVTRLETELTSVAKASLEDRGKQLAIRHAARGVVKHNIAHAVSREDQLAGELVRLLFVVLEQADTRSWESLPATLTLARIPLPAGVHDVSLTVGSGASTFRLVLDDIPIRPGRRTFRSLRPSVGAQVHFASRSH